MPGVSGVTVVTNARVYYTPRAAAGAPSARHSLCPLMLGGIFSAKLARNPQRDREAVSAKQCGCLKIESVTLWAGALADLQDRSLRFSCRKARAPCSSRLSDWRRGSRSHAALSHEAAKKLHLSILRPSFFSLELHLFCLARSIVDRGAFNGQGGLQV